MGGSMPAVLLVVADSLNGAQGLYASNPTVPSSARRSRRVRDSENKMESSMAACPGHARKGVVERRQRRQSEPLSNAAHRSRGVSRRFNPSNNYNVPPTTGSTALLRQLRYRHHGRTAVANEKNYVSQDELARVKPRSKAKLVLP